MSIILIYFIMGVTFLYLYLLLSNLPINVIVSFQNVATESRTKATQMADGQLKSVTRETPTRTHRSSPIRATADAVRTALRACRIRIRVESYHLVAATTSLPLRLLRSTLSAAMSLPRIVQPASLLSATRDVLPCCYQHRQLARTS